MFDELKKFKTLSIDFKKPWWYLIYQQKWLFFIVIFVLGTTQVYWSLAPFVAAKLFESKSIGLLITIFVLWLLVDFIFALIRTIFSTKFQLQCVHSIYYNAYLFLTTVDPKYHIHRSSGSIIAKIERAARGYEDFADLITFEATPLIIGLITVIITLGYYSIFLASIVTFFIFIILAIGYYFAIYKCYEWEGKFIKSDDFFKSTAVENLTQIQLIRSTFASNFRLNKLHTSILDNMYIESLLWFAYGYLFTFLGLLYIFSLFILSFLLLLQVKSNNISSATAVGLFLVYIQSSRETVRFGRLLRKIMHCRESIRDLFEFIPNFGKQNYPVLGPSTLQVVRESNIVIDANNISFDYGKAVLFNCHSLKLSCANDHQTKLFGIIGPSGTGKTTLLSILGGQLKPNTGNILINNIDIYTINDADRSKMISLQGQVASNIRGTVRSNLLLGLPDYHTYNDHDLIEILNKVGLLTTLEKYNGLDTMLGEGGLNISGGQRQRLNFAGLYLRANFYKPFIVLIDEPTSSLDEISEIAITNMIEELSKHSITFVVAHRLKTIEKATGIIDLSLLSKEKFIKIYSPGELQLYSNYYKELMSGKIHLDNH